jgi:exodeoxyribonuclease VII large subunit
MNIERKIYKVSQINQAARTVLEANFADLWIEGEISNLIVPSSGHMYFSLKDENAQVRCVMFRNHQANINFEPKNGDHIIVHAQVSLYEARGEYQLLVFYMEAAGSGILHAKFLALKNKLEQEGLFALEHKKALPQVPHCIGVVTSPTGAAVRDILTVLKRRFPSVPIIIYPTQVQGAEAAGQIANAVATANTRNECDVLIVARGGGSLEDLWPFNEEVVARAIFASCIPIISAVGHEIDFTIADFVADVRAPTPSAAAELAVPDWHEWLAKCDQLQKRMTVLLQHKITADQLMLTNLQKRLRHPRELLLQQVQKMDELERRLRLAMQHRFEHWQQRFLSLSNALELVSPLATLQRGFAIVTKDKKIVNDASTLQRGDRLVTRFAHGAAQCVVDKV